MENTKFKAFERVLVRNNKNETWRIGFFEAQLSESSFLCMQGAFRYCISYEGNEHLLHKTEEPEVDLAIDTPVMCNCGADKKWHFGYYAGHGEVWMHGCRSTDNVGRCAWYNIVPYSKFNPEDLEGNMQHNIVKHEGQKG